MLEPGPLHASLPTVVAISTNPHILLTSSEQPSLIYLQHRTSGTQPLLLTPLASCSPVVRASFHPSRSNVFLLAFKDGTVAAYDAAELFHDRKDIVAYPQAVGGETYTFRGLHIASSHIRQSSFGALSSVPSSPLGQSITGLEFITGHRSRAVTCGADGNCRILDFETKMIVRSWHVRAPATALSLLSSKSAKSPLVAVGKLDGKVSIHELSGALLHEVIVGGFLQQVNCARANEH